MGTISHHNNKMLCAVKSQDSETKWCLILIALHWDSETKWCLILIALQLAHCQQGQLLLPLCHV